MKEKETVDSPAEEATESKDFEKHEIEGAAHHLMEAEKVKSNKPLHAKAVAHLKGQHGHIEKIASLDKLREVAKKKIKENDDGSSY